MPLEPPARPLRLPARPHRLPTRLLGPPARLPTSLLGPPARFCRLKLRLGPLRVPSIFIFYLGLWGPQLGLWGPQLGLLGPLLGLLGFVHLLSRHLAWSLLSQQSLRDFHPVIREIQFISNCQYSSDRPQGSLDRSSDTVASLRF